GNDDHALHAKSFGERRILRFRSADKLRRRDSWPPFDEVSFTSLRSLDLARSGRWGRRLGALFFRFGSGLRGGLLALRLRFGRRLGRGRRRGGSLLGRDGRRRRSRLALVPVRLGELSLDLALLLLELLLELFAFLGHRLIDQTGQIRLRTRRRLPWTRRAGRARTRRSRRAGRCGRGRRSSRQGSRRSLGPDAAEDEDRGDRAGEQDRRDRAPEDSSAFLRRLEGCD